MLVMVHASCENIHNTHIKKDTYTALPRGIPIEDISFNSLVNRDSTGGGKWSLLGATILSC